MQRTQAPESKPLGEIQLMEVELRGDEHAHEHGDNAKDDRRQHKLAHNPVIVFDGYFLGHESGGAAVERDQD